MNSNIFRYVDKAYTKNGLWINIKLLIQLILNHNPIKLWSKRRYYHNAKLNISHTKI